MCDRSDGMHGATEGFNGYLLFVACPDSLTRDMAYPFNHCRIKAHGLELFHTSLSGRQVSLHTNGEDIQLQYFVIKFSRSSCEI